MWPCWPKKKEQAAAPVALSPGVEKLLDEMFAKMDGDNSRTVTMLEAATFWGKNFAKVNAKAMFNEVDANKDGKLSPDEWRGFWMNVVKHGYSEEEVMEELNSMMTGGSWVDWNDGRTT